SKNFTQAKGTSGIQKPEETLSVHAVCAAMEEEARLQLAPVNIMYKNLSVGRMDIPMPSTDDAVKQLVGLDELNTYIELPKVLPKFIGGTPEMIQDQFEKIIKDFGANEIIIQDMITDEAARFRSYELMANMISVPAS